jgi:GNAT superfamily N-acetyltransferase
MAALLGGHLRARVRTAGARPVGPFLVLLDPDHPGPFHNYAVPAPGARPTLDEQEELRRVFVGAGRLPRLEYFPAESPEVAGDLARSGFTVEHRARALVLGPPVPEGPVPDGVTLSVVRPDDEAATVEVLAVAQRAFGEPAPDRADRARLAAGLAAGAVAVLARARPGGRALGSARATAPAAGVTEVVGVAVEADARRRGLGGALAAAAAAAALSAPGCSLAWLVPGDPGAASAYIRAGFAEGPEALHLRGPG